MRQEVLGEAQQEVEQESMGQDVGEAQVSCGCRQNEVHLSNASEMESETDVAKVANAVNVAKAVSAVVKANNSGNTVIVGKVGVEAAWRLAPSPHRDKCKRGGVCSSSRLEA